MAERLCLPFDCISTDFIRLWDKQLNLRLLVFKFLSFIRFAILSAPDFFKIGVVVVFNF